MDRLGILFFLLSFNLTTITSAQNLAATASATTSMNQIAVGADGETWGLNNSGFIFHWNAQSQTWQTLPGLLSQIAVGGGAFVWGINSAGQIYHYDTNAQTWNNIPGALSEISVGADGDVWGINSGQQVFHYDAARQEWIYIPILLAHLAVGNNSAVWALDSSDNIYRFNIGTQAFEQISGALKQISVGADGDIWGINAANQVYHFNTLLQNWEGVDGSLSQISVGSATNVCGVNPEGNIYTFDVKTQNWRQISGTVSHLSAGANGAVWGVNNAGNTYELASSQPSGPWQALPGWLSQIAVGPDNNVWGIAGTSIYHYNSRIQDWEQVPGTLAQIAVGFGGEVWGLNSTGLIYRYDAEAHKWTNIPGALSQISIGANGDVWGINPASLIYRYERDGNTWQWIPGALKQLSVGSDGTVWGVNSIDQIYRYNSMSQGWQYIPGALRQIVVGSKDNIWGLNAAGAIYRFDSAAQNWVNIPGFLSQISVAFDGTVWGINASSYIYHFNSSGQNWDSIAGTLSQVVVGASGGAWGINSAGSIFRTSSSILAASAASSPTQSAVGSTNDSSIAAMPVLTQSSSAYSSATAVHMTCTTGSSTIFYTTDGSIPSHTSRAFTTDIGVSSSETVTAICSAPGYQDSAIATLQLTLAATPTYSIPSGTYSSPQQLSMSCSSPAATIYYTTDGATPNTSSTRYVPGSPLSISSSELVSAICAVPGYVNSLVAGIAVIIQNQSDATSLTFTVDQSTVGANIPSDFLGFSFDATSIAQSWFRTTNTTLINLLNNLGAGTIRTGASGVDYTYWSRDTSITFPQAQAILHPSDIDAMFAFTKQVGWRVIFGLNLLAGNPTMDADEASYVAQIAGPNLVAFEIGNEPDGYVGAGQKASYSYAAFRNDFDTFSQAIRAHVPNAPIAGPVTSGNWLANFLRDESQQLSSVSQHYYATKNLTPAILSATTAANTASILQAASSAAQPYQLPVRMAETNSEWNAVSTGDVANTFMDTLWMTDYLFSAATQGIAGVNIHGGFGLCRYYSPLCSTNGRVVPQAAYYAMLLFHYAASQGKMVPITASSNQNMTAYAIVKDDGGLNVVLINKDSSTPVSAQISPGKAYARAIAQRLKSSSLLATSGITFAGNAVKADGTWSAGASETVSMSNGVYPLQVPAASAVVISFQ